MRINPLICKNYILLVSLVKNFKKFIVNNTPLIFYYTLLIGKFKRLVTSNRKIGTNIYIDPSVILIGIENIQIGDYSLLSEGVWLNVNHRDNRQKKIIIGNNCHIGKSNYFSAGPLIILKDYCFTGIDCQFLGCGHKIDSPFTPYRFSGLSEGKTIEVGVNCWLTTSVTIMEGVKIGHGSIIGARSLVVDDIPPFSIAVGNPCKVIKRFSFKTNKWVRISDWDDEAESLILTESYYLKSLRNKYYKLPFSYQASGARFGWI